MLLLKCVLGVCHFISIFCEESEIDFVLIVSSNLSIRNIYISLTYRIIEVTRQSQKNLIYVNSILTPGKDIKKIIS